MNLTRAITCEVSSAGILLRADDALQQLHIRAGGNLGGTLDSTMGSMRGTTDGALSGAAMRLATFVRRGGTTVLVTAGTTTGVPAQPSS